MLPAVSRGVEADWFLTQETKQVWSFIHDHYGKYGEVPTAVTVKDNFPTFRLLNVKDSQDYLLDQFVEHRLSTKTLEIVSEAVQKVSDPTAHAEVVAGLRKGLAELDGEAHDDNDLDVTEDAKDRFAEYKARKTNPGGLLGVSTGFPTIDEATAGLQGGQLVTIIASPKTGKSQLLMKLALHAHELGMSPTFQSYEMSNLEQQQRFDAMKAQVSHNRLRRGMLTAPEEARYLAMLTDLETKHPLVFTDSASGTTVSMLSAKIAAYNPDIVFVDGTYLMIDEVTGESNTPQAITNITRSLKRLAQRLDKPVVISTQTLLWKMKGNSLNAGSIGYSSSFYQDSDVILGLENIEDVPDKRLLKIVASRNCGPAEVELMWDWDRGRFEEDADQTSAYEDAESDDDEIEFDTGVA